MSTAVAAEARHRPAPTFGVVLAVLGVVYGDIGTSPLYAFKASLQHFKAGDVTNLEIMGILSLIFWSLVLVVTVKYVLLLLRADNADLRLTDRGTALGCVSGYRQRAFADAQRPFDDDEAGRLRSPGGDWRAFGRGRFVRRHDPGDRECARL